MVTEKKSVRLNTGLAACLALSASICALTACGSPPTTTTTTRSVTTQTTAPAMAPDQQTTVTRQTTTNP